MKVATTLRPPAFGGLPLGVIWHYVQAPQDGKVYWGFDGKALPHSHYHYGVIETDRDLTDAEMRHFDIVLVS